MASTSANDDAGVISVDRNENASNSTDVAGIDKDKDVNVGNSADVAGVDKDKNIVDRSDNIAASRLGRRNIRK